MGGGGEEAAEIFGCGLLWFEPLRLPPCAPLGVVGVVTPWPTATTGCVCTPTMAAAAEEIGDNFEVCVAIVEEPVGWAISNNWLRNSSQFRLRIKSSLLTQ